MGNNKLEIFKNEKFGEVRTIVIDNEPWFIGKDIATVLGYSNPNEAILDHIDEEDKLNSKTLSSFELNLGQRGGWLINESGLYSLILLSKLPMAKEFKRWITHDVIPSIRKHGAYMTENTLESCINNPDFAIGLLTALKEEREKSNILKAKVTEQNKQIEEMKPKASYYDIILNCKDSMPITNISKDYGMSAKAMNAKLHELGVQYKQSGMWLLYQKYANMGYTQSKTFAIDTDNSHMHTYWTQKGRVFLYNLLKENEIIPTMERGDEN